MSRTPLRAASTFEQLLARAESRIVSAVRDLPIDYFHGTIEGLENLPTGGALLVCNHALMGLDAFVLGALVVRDTGRHIRFLGDRNLFRVPVLSEVLGALRAVPGVPDAAVEMLKEGELVGVYPGGADDSFKESSQRHLLQWGTRSGFARVAVRAGVPIVPVAGIGIDDMFTVVARERVVGRALFGSERYDLPIAYGAYGTMIPRRAPQHFVVLPPIDTSGSADDPKVIERVRAEAHDRLAARLADAARA